MNRKTWFRIITIISVGIIFTACSKKGTETSVGSVSSKTGVKYSKNPSKGFSPQKAKDYTKVPGMILVAGGTFIMGGGEKDIEFQMDARSRQVTVQSFYMDKEEVANVDWKEFLYNVENGTEGSEVIEMKLEDLYPDTLLWARDLAFNEPLVNQYYQHPSFNKYPVVGITWHQANEYCKWRTSFVNSQLKAGKSGKGKKSASGNGPVLYPDFRLPTEAEWEYAARGLQESELYAWEGKSLRNRKGQFRANFKRGRGDYAGWAGGNGRHLSDKYVTPAPVGSYWANDFGLYNMSGNVAEWTQDTYRVLAYEDVDDLNPYRRQGKTVIRPESWLDDDSYDPKSSLLFNPDPNASEGSGEFDNIKVYRGGSWNDIAYYLSPGVRRFFPADSASNTIGFRCAMIKVGTPN